MIPTELIAPLTEYLNLSTNNIYKIVVIRCPQKDNRIISEFIFLFVHELFCDFLQFDWLHERAAFYDILASASIFKEIYFSKEILLSKRKV